MLNFQSKIVIEKLIKTRVVTDIVCSPKGYGGMGLRCFYKMNEACAIKQIWNLLNGDNLWCRWLKNKYLGQKSF